MIAVFPGDIGKADSAILTVGDDVARHAARALFTTLSGRSRFLDGDFRALLAFFAGPSDKHVMDLTRVFAE